MDGSTNSKRNEQASVGICCRSDNTGAVRAWIVMPWIVDQELEGVLNHWQEKGYSVFQLMRNTGVVETTTVVFKLNELLQQG